MNTKIEKRRNELKAEIIVARQRLHYNFSNLEIVDYFGGGKKMAVQAAANLFDLQGGDIILKLNTVSKQFLSSDSKIRKILKWMSMIVQGKKVLSSLRK